jgi:cobaltochelatase CobS
MTKKSSFNAQTLRDKLNAQRGQQEQAVEIKKKAETLFQHKPKHKAAAGQKMYSKVFGEVPKGKIDFPITCYNDSDWPEQVQHLIPTTFDYTLSDWFYKMVQGIEHNDISMLMGDAGCGKTAAVEYYCSVVRMPYHRINGTEGGETVDLIGTDKAKEGSTYWADGPLAVSVRYGGMLLLDEPTKLNSGVAMCLMPLLENRGRLLLYGNEAEQFIDRPEGLRVVLADNVSGNGDGMDVYAATQIQDSALLNRVNHRVMCDYLSTDQEVAALMKYNSILQEDEAKLMVKMANSMRGLFRKRVLQDAFSFRNMMAWVDKYERTGDVQESFIDCCTYSYVDDDTKRAIKELWTDCGFGVALR